MLQYVIGINTSNINRFHTNQIACGFNDIFLVAGENQQRIGSLKLTKQADNILGFRCCQLQIIQNNQLVLTHLTGQSRGQSNTALFSGHFEAIRTGSGRKHHTTSAPDWAAAAAGTCMTGAFLTPRLFAAARNFASGLGFLSTLPAAGQIKHNSLMHKSFVNLTVKHSVIQFQSFHCVAVHIINLNTCHLFVLLSCLMLARQI